MHPPYRMIAASGLAALLVAGSALFGNGAVAAGLCHTGPVAAAAPAAHGLSHPTPRLVLATASVVETEIVVRGGAAIQRVAARVEADVRLSPPRPRGIDGSAAESCSLPASGWLTDLLSEGLALIERGRAYAARLAEGLSSLFAPPEAPERDPHCPATPPPPAPEDAPRSAYLT